MNATTPPDRRPLRTPAVHWRRPAQPVQRLSVPLAEAAEMIGVSYNTLWRAVRDHQFPGVKIRDRIVIPIKAIERIFEDATTSGQLIDAAQWTADWTATHTPTPGDGPGAPRGETTLR